MLNVGLQAGILSQKVFTIFVVMALVTTFLTTPVTTFLYNLSNNLANLDIRLGINERSRHGVAAKSIGTAIPSLLQTMALQTKRNHSKNLLFRIAWSS